MPRKARDMTIIVRFDDSIDRPVPSAIADWVMDLIAEFTNEYWGCEFTYNEFASFAHIGWYAPMHRDLAWPLLFAKRIAVPTGAIGGELQYRICA